jgi:hypothetical protein
MTCMRSWKSHRLTSDTWLGLNPQIVRPLSRIVGVIGLFIFFFFYLIQSVLNQRKLNFHETFHILKNKHQYLMNKDDGPLESPFLIFWSMIKATIYVNFYILFHNAILVLKMVTLSQKSIYKNNTWVMRIIPLKSMNVRETTRLICSFQLNWISIYNLNAFSNSNRLFQNRTVILPINEKFIYNTRVALL